jgi:hypothetical protein
VNGWLTAADRFIPGLNDATGGRDAEWFTSVLVNHCRTNQSLTIADALEQIVNIRFSRLFAEKAAPITYRSTATNNVLDKPAADETIRAATDRAEAAASRAEKAAASAATDRAEPAAPAPPKLSTLSDNPPTTPYLGLDDIARIHSTYKANQARFVRDFVGKAFSARTPLGDITENLMFKGSFNVSFGGNSWGGDVQCKFSDQSDVARITEMNKGDIVKIRGVIEDHSFGTIDLEDCSISASQ